MKRIRLVLAVAAVVAAMVAMSASPAAAAQDPFPFCEWFETNGEGADYRSNGIALYYDYWYGSHKWCESPVQGWYVIE
jgi:hypothetical protein